ncbi:hypothetical protein [Peredibacter starrii]|uniref:Uncharacterized protein n=1 Tax=Peredibacter starrii TaxID=28202 RepID=A0AAX4HUN1_9BACT|nr:hypothetical protein [Peredibacter starrii]WPU66654.1 hypothetical protein SOO65_07840 [Peredibacter starrii]
MLKLLPLLLVFACAHQPTFQMDANRVTWIDRSEDDVLTHPHFSTMPVQERVTSTGTKMFSFKNEARSGETTCGDIRWGGKCNTVVQDQSCNHVFTVKKSVVVEYNRVGACGPEQLKFRPFQDGEPVLTDREAAHFGSRDVASETKKKNCGIAGQLFGC